MKKFLLSIFFAISCIIVFLSFHLPRYGLIGHDVYILSIDLIGSFVILAELIILNLLVFRLRFFVLIALAELIMSVYLASFTKHWQLAHWPQINTGVSRFAVFFLIGFVISYMLSKFSVLQKTR